MTMVSVEASLFDFATRMEVDGFPTGEIALSSAYQGRSAADQRFMYRACREIVVHLKGALKGERMYHINLRRVQ
jgi:hypothetical protein